MIADLFLLLFPLLAAIPAVIAVLLARFPGQEEELALPHVMAFAVPFAIWQWTLNAFVYDLSTWQIWIRLLDPIGVVGMMSAVLRAENQFSDTSDRRYVDFLKSASPWLIVNSLIQVATLLELLPVWISAVMTAYLGWKIVLLYSRFTVRPRIRQRVSMLLWVATSILPLPFLRIFFLGHLAWIWFLRLLQAIDGVTRRENQYRDEKKIIGEVSESLTSAIQDVGNFRQSLKEFLNGLGTALESKAGAVYLWHAEENVYRLGEVTGLFFPMSPGGDPSFLREKVLHEQLRNSPVADSDHLVWICGHSNELIHSPFAGQDSRVTRLGARGRNIQSLLLVPLYLEQERLGVLVLQNKLYERYFSESDAYLAKTFAHYATLMINASRMMRERADRDRVQNELQLGQRIQNDLLPERIPQVEGIDLAGSMVPAKEIGGDYYDFIEVSQERLGIAIGDVSGKGVPAGMLMTILQTLLHSEYQHHNNTKDLLVEINSMLSEKIKSSMFITFLLFEWNCKNRSLKYTACGHEHILHFHGNAKRLDCFRSGGIALGMTDDNSSIVRERDLPIESGDTVVLYTDGIVEARNPQGDMYGLDRLKQVVSEHAGIPAEALRQRLIQDLDFFRKGADQADDITCIVMRFL